MAAAAYRSGTLLENQWDGQVHDYTRKGGIIHSEILLPLHAPKEFLNRSALWNSVEQIEKSSRAQLARELEIALPVELTREDQISLVRAYVQQNFVDAGMCADFSVHDKGDGNPHAHIMLTMRPLAPDGNWAAKSKLEYDLDENGQRIRLPSGRYKSHKVNTVDWNEQTKAEDWRAAWADCCNAALERTGSAERIDHRSYERQGVEQIPTIHIGVAATKLARRGVDSERVELNRIIRRDNQLLRRLKQQIAALAEKLKDLVRRINTQKQPTVWDLLCQYSQQRIDDASAGKSAAYHNKVSAAELQKQIDYFSFLQTHHITTVEQLQSYLTGLQDEVYQQTEQLNASSKRMKELSDLLRYAKQYQANQPVYQAYCQQKTKGKWEKFYAAHRTELAMYQMAKRELDKRLPDKQLHLEDWETEYGALKSERAAEYEKLKAIRADVRDVQEIAKRVTMAQAQRDGFVSTRSTDLQM